MDKDRRKELREQYERRHPDMGVVTWQCGDRIWAMTTRDANADYNGMSFQLRLGSWPGKELQQAYKADPDGFRWTLEKRLDYDDLNDDHSDDLMLLLMEFLDEHPDARPMKPGLKGFPAGAAGRFDGR